MTPNEGKLTEPSRLRRFNCAWFEHLQSKLSNEYTELIGCTATTNWPRNGAPVMTRFLLSEFLTLEFFYVHTLCANRFGCTVRESENDRRRVGRRQKCQP